MLEDADENVLELTELVDRTMFSPRLVGARLELFDSGNGVSRGEMLEGLDEDVTVKLGVLELSNIDAFELGVGGRLVPLSIAGDDNVIEGLKVFPVTLELSITWDDGGVIGLVASE